MYYYFLVFFVIMILYSLYGQEADYLWQRTKRTAGFKTSSDLVNYYGYHMR